MHKTTKTKEKKKRVRMVFRFYETHDGLVNGKPTITRVLYLPEGAYLYESFPSPKKITKKKL